jgi:hypothetical protein
VYTNAMRLSSWTSPRRDRREQLCTIKPLLQIRSLSTFQTEDASKYIYNDCCNDS